MKRVKKDLEKLQKMLFETGQSTNAKFGYFILLDGLNRKKMPYYVEEVKGWADMYNVCIYYWPDSTEPIEKPRSAEWKKYCN